MTRRGKSDATIESSEVARKLDRLLQTEASLDAMLEDTKREAREIVGAAQREAEDQIRGFESHLENEHWQLRKRIEQERDRTIESIRREAASETDHLEELDHEQLRSLAQRVVDFLLGRSEPEEAP